MNHFVYCSSSAPKKSSQTQAQTFSSPQADRCPPAKKKNKKQKRKNRQSPQELSSYIFGLYVPAWTQLVRWTDTWTSQADWFGVVRSAGLGRLADYSFIDRLVKIHESMKKHRAFFGVLQ